MVFKTLKMNMSRCEAGGLSSSRSQQVPLPVRTGNWGSWRNTSWSEESGFTGIPWPPPDLSPVRTFGMWWDHRRSDRPTRTVWRWHVRTSEERLRRCAVRRSNLVARCTWRSGWCWLWFWWRGTDWTFVWSLMQLHGSTLKLLVCWVGLRIWLFQAEGRFSGTELSDRNIWFFWYWTTSQIQLTLLRAGCDGGQMTPVCSTAPVYNKVPLNGVVCWTLSDTSCSTDGPRRLLLTSAPNWSFTTNRL